jgi:hypothetical protein
MSRTVFIFITQFWVSICNSQASYFDFQDVTHGNGISEYSCVDQVSCADCDKQPSLSAAQLKHNELAAAWQARGRRMLKEECLYDSVYHYYLATDSFLKLIRSEYYFWFFGNVKDRIFKGPNQNSSSPEYVFSPGDSAVGTVRYRVVCRDCPYPKKRPLYYIFYYDSKGDIVRHGLAYLDKKSKRK